MAKITGVVFYKGKSRIDGQPIVAIATFNTDNAKTGKLVQTWILRSDKDPIEAVNDDSDKSICGNCPLRGRIADASERIHESTRGGTTVNKGRSCYVTIQNAPLAVYRAFVKGLYPELSPEHAPLMSDKGLRYGSYGDPVAVPMKAWDRLKKFCTGKTAGYTHQWADKRFRHWSKRVMASTHSVEENAQAHATGWRTFRTVASEADKGSGEIHCPASTEGGFRKTCAECGACNGRNGTTDGRVSVVIVAHGGSGKVQQVARVIESRRIALSLAA